MNIIFFLASIIFTGFIQSSDDKPSLSAQGQERQQPTTGPIYSQNFYYQLCQYLEGLPPTKELMVYVNPGSITEVPLDSSMHAAQELITAIERRTNRQVTFAHTTAHTTGKLLCFEPPAKAIKMYFYDNAMTTDATTEQLPKGFFIGKVRQARQD